MRRFLRCLFVIGCIMIKTSMLNAEITVSQGVWDGPGRSGEDCWFLENPAIRVAVLTKGAYVVSVVDKNTGEDFINCKSGGREAENGIYDRVAYSGKHTSIGNNDEHFGVALFQIKQSDPGVLECSATSDVMRIDKTVSLDPVLPKLSISVKYTAVGEELLQTRICHVAQFNLNSAPVVFNQAAALPGQDKVTVLTYETGGYGVEKPRAGWWFVADRESKKSVLMVHPVDPEQVSQIYQYRVRNWIHCLPFGPTKTLKKGENLSQSQGFYFLPSSMNIDSLESEDVSGLQEPEFARMKSALSKELAKSAVRPGVKMKVGLPADFTPVAPEPSPAGVPEATVLLARNAVYYHPTNIHALLWSSLDDCLKGVADVKNMNADLLVVCGASHNGEQDEMDLAQRAVALAGHDSLFVPNAVDMKNKGAFESLFGELNWTRQIRDVVFVGYSGDDSAWLKKTLAENTTNRVVLISDRPHTALSSDTNPSLVMARLNTGTVSFDRIGNWPVVWNPSLQGGGTIAVINVFPDFIEVYMKPVGSSFGPRLYVDAKGKGFNIPPFINQQPVLKTAHVVDTQIALESRLKIEGEPVDQENTRIAFEEINRLGVDFVVHAGDFVNEGDSDEEWKIYTDLRNTLTTPVYETLGNHDVSGGQLLDDGTTLYSTEHYDKYSTSPLVWSIETNGVLFAGFATMTVTPEQLAEFLPLAEQNKCVVLVYHDPINESGAGYTWWSPELYKAAFALRPTLAFAGHTHALKWNDKNGLREFIGSGLGWTKTGDQAWNGYFIHTFFDNKVVSSFKKLGCDDLFFTTVTPYSQR